MPIVRLPPEGEHNPAGWIRALLTDLAGDPEVASELLEAVRAAQRGRAGEWAAGYNAYTVEVRPDGVEIILGDRSCVVPLEVAAEVLGEHLAR